MEAITKEEIFDDTHRKGGYSRKQKSRIQAEEKRNEPIDAEYEQIDDRLFGNPSVKCIAEFLFFAGIEYVVFYWLQTGQMELSAAMPSMIVCAFLAGWSIKKNWKRRN